MVSCRRQAVIGAFIVDFPAPAMRPIVDHAAWRRWDAMRHRIGYRVLRLEAQLVLHYLPAAGGVRPGALNA